MPKIPLSNFYKTLSTSPWFSHGLAVFGGLLFFFQSRYYAFTQISVLDEGAYLLKGLLFLDGTYSPFQDYGPLTNHMPLSFLTHGVVQTIFGPGVREARYFMLFVGLLMLAGVWLLVKKLRGPWLAAFAVGAIAINPGTARFYSLAITQGLIACLLVWTLYFSYASPGKNRSLAALTFSGFLAGVIGLTRLNMIPVLPLLVLYIFWAHGKKAGWWAFSAGLLTFLIGNLLFFPEILKIWAYWIPDAISPFLAPWRQPEIGRLWNPNIPFDNRLHSFLEGLRIHFASFSGLLIILLFWQRKKQQKIDEDLKNIIFWAILFTVLVIEHAFASVGLNYCVYCFSIYMAFFAPVGVILLAVSFRSFSTNPGWVRTSLIGLTLVVFTTLLGFGAFKQIGDSLALIEIPRFITALIGWRPDTYYIWGVLDNRFGIDYAASRMLLPTIAGLLTGLLVVLVGLLISRKQGKPAAQMVLVLLIIGFLALPSDILGNTYQNFDCGQDVISGYEELGQELDILIATQQNVYWRGGESVVPLLYVPNGDIYPSQINGHFAIYDYDDSDALTKFGLWSEALSDQWLLEADIVLIEEKEYTRSLAASIDRAGLDEAQRTTAPFTCRPDSRIIVFRKTSSTD